MDRRDFLRVTGIGAAATVAGRSTLIAPATAGANPAELPPVKKLPGRSEVPVADTWDLSRLYPNNESWKKRSPLGPNRSRASRRSRENSPRVPRCWPSASAST